MTNKRDAIVVVWLMGLTIAGFRGSSIGRELERVSYGQTPTCTTEIVQQSPPSPPSGQFFLGQAFSGTGGDAEFSIKAKCQWRAIPNVPWITIHQGAANGDGPVRFSVSANSTGRFREGEILLGSRTFLVHQTKHTFRVVIRADSSGGPDGIAAFARNGTVIWARRGGAGGGRGFNVAFFDGETGEVIPWLNPVTKTSEAARNIDTWGGGNPAHVLLREYVGSARPGTIVVIAVGDAAGLNGSEESRKTIAFLEELGSSRIKDHRFREGWSFISESGSKEPLAETFSTGWVSAEFAFGGTGSIAMANAASYRPPPAAPDMIITAFGGPFVPTFDPVNPSQVRIHFIDSGGTYREGFVFYASPSQLNIHAPGGMALGPAAMKAYHPDGSFARGTAEIARVAPGIFTANSDGQGVPAAYVLRVRPNNRQLVETVHVWDQALRTWVPEPIDVEPPSDQVFLILYATGVRGRSALSGVTVIIGGTALEVTYAGPAPGYRGLDQINARLPLLLKGRGEVEVVTTVDGQIANTVKVRIR